MNTSIFNYNGSNITFQTGNGNLMICATEMAKPFNKRVQHFLETDQTKQYIQAYSQSRNIGFDDLIKIIRGGSSPGTWMHEDIALEFSRWLSPEFSIWCNSKIKELLKTGSTQIDFTDPDKMMIILQNWSQEKKKREAAENEVKKLTPKAQLMDRVMATEDNIDIGQAAKILGLPFGRNTFFKKLREMGIFFKSRNEPMQRYMGSGYFLLK